MPAPFHPRAHSSIAAHLLAPTPPPASRTTSLTERRPQLLRLPVTRSPPDTVATIGRVPRPTPRAPRILAPSRYSASTPDSQRWRTPQAAAIPRLQAVQAARAGPVP